MGEWAKRGSSALEFVVLTAVLLVLGLVVANLLGLGALNTTNAKAQQSRVYWMAQAYPLKITDWALYTTNSTSAGIITTQSNLTLALLNPTREALVINAIYVGPGNFTQVYDQNGTWLGPVEQLHIRVESGGTKTIIIQHYEQGAKAFIIPKNYELDVRFTYAGSLQAAGAVETAYFPPTMAAMISTQQSGSLPVIGVNQYVAGALGSGACPAPLVSCNGVCCASDVCCGGTCWLPSVGTCDANCTCCAAGQTPCNGVCCGAGQICKDNTCELATTCTGNATPCGGFCCEAGLYCADPAASTYEGACVGTCASPNVTCGDFCCPASQTCANSKATTWDGACGVNCTGSDVSRCLAVDGSSESCCSTGLSCANATGSCCNTTSQTYCSFTNSSGKFAACCDPATQNCVGGSIGCCSKAGAICNLSSDCCTGWTCNNGVCSACGSGGGTGCCAENHTILCNFRLNDTDPISTRDWSTGTYQDCCLQGNRSDGQYVNETCGGNWFNGTHWRGCPTNPTIPTDPSCSIGMYWYNRTHYSLNGITWLNWTGPLGGTYQNETLGCCVNDTKGYCDPQEGIYCCPGLYCNTNTHTCSTPFSCPNGTVMISGDETSGTCCPTSRVCGYGSSLSCCYGYQKTFFGQGSLECRCCDSYSDVLCGSSGICCPAGQCDQRTGTCCAVNTTVCRTGYQAYACCNNTSACLANPKTGYNVCCAKGSAVCSNGACCASGTCTSAGCCNTSAGSGYTICSLTNSTCCGPSPSSVCAPKLNSSGNNTSATACCPAGKTVACGSSNACCTDAAHCVSNSSLCCEDRSGQTPNTDLCNGACCYGGASACVGSGVNQTCCPKPDYTSPVLCGPSNSCCEGDGRCVGTGSSQKCCFNNSYILCNGTGDCCPSADLCTGTHCCPASAPNYCTGDGACCASECTMGTNGKTYCCAAPNNVSYCAGNGVCCNTSCKTGNMCCNTPTSESVLNPVTSTYKCCPDGKKTICTGDQQCCDSCTPGSDGKTYCCSSPNNASYCATNALCCNESCQAIGMCCPSGVSVQNLSAGSGGAYTCCPAGKSQICTGDGKCCDTCTPGTDGKTYCCSSPNNKSYCAGSSSCCASACTTGSDGKAYCCAAPNNVSYCAGSSSCCNTSCQVGSNGQSYCCAAGKTFCTNSSACCDSSCTKSSSGGQYCCAAPNNVTYCPIGGCCSHACNTNWDGTTPTTCCSNASHVVTKSGACCDPAMVYGNGYYCCSGTLYTTSSGTTACCASGKSVYSVNGVNICCASQPASNGVCCADYGYKISEDGTACCPSSGTYYSCTDNSCCDHACAADKTCGCPSGQTKMSDGTCCDDALVVGGSSGTCCKSGTVTDDGVCCDSESVGEDLINGGTVCCANYYPAGARADECALKRIANDANLDGIADNTCCWTGDPPCSIEDPNTHLCTPECTGVVTPTCPKPYVYCPATMVHGALCCPEKTDCSNYDYKDCWTWTQHDVG